MRRVLIAAILLGCGPPLAGCVVVAEHPLGPPARREVDQRLPGVWVQTGVQRGDRQLYLHVSAPDTAWVMQGALVQHNRDQVEVWPCEFSLSLLGETTILNFRDLDGRLLEPAPGRYTFLQVTFADNNTLQLRGLKGAPVRKAFESGQLGGEYVKSVARVASPPERFAAWLAGYRGEYGPLFDGPEAEPDYCFRRVVPPQWSATVGDTVTDSYRPREISQPMARQFYRAAGRNEQPGGAR